MLYCVLRSLMDAREKLELDNMKEHAPEAG